MDIDIDYLTCHKLAFDVLTDFILQYLRCVLTFNCTCVFLFAKSLPTQSYTGLNGVTHNEQCIYLLNNVFSTACDDQVNTQSVIALCNAVL